MRKNKQFHLLRDQRNLNRLANRSHIKYIFSITKCADWQIENIYTKVDWLCKNCNKDCSIDWKDYYMLTDEVWAQIHPAKTGMLCMDCTETKLGRPIEKSDLTHCVLNTDLNYYTREILTNQ